MKNIIEYKGHKIQRMVVVLLDGEYVDEFDSMAEANASFYKKAGQYEFKYAAAEWINDDGDLNPAVYGDTLKEATDKLKKLL